MLYVVCVNTSNMVAVELLSFDNSFRFENDGHKKKRVPLARPSSTQSLPMSIIGLRVYTLNRDVHKISITFLDVAVSAC